MPEIEKTPKYFTHNLQYAAYLAYMGFDFLEIVKSEYKAGFYDFAFDWIGNVKEFESNYFNNKAMVEPRKYNKIASDLRAQLNARRREDLAKDGVPIYK